MTTPSPLGPDTDLVSFTVTVNGTAIPDTCNVISIEVESAANRIPFAVIEVTDGEPAEADFPVSSGGLFSPGATLVISLGYHDSVKEVFSGLITGQGLRQKADGSCLRVEAHHLVVKGSLNKKNGIFENKTDSDVISQLLKESGATVSVNGSGSSQPQLVQYYTSNWDFVVSRAEANGWVVCALPDKVEVGTPGSNSTAVLKLTYGEDVLDFDLDLDALSQVGTVECNAWSYADQTLSSASSSSAAVNPVGNLKSASLADTVGNATWALQSSAELSQDDLTAWATGEYTRRSYAKVTGTVSFQGSALVLPGTLVTLAGFGKVFDGDVFVGGVRHALDGRGHWTTQVTVGLIATGFSSRVATAAPLASGLLPGARGLLNAVVKAVANDPDNAYRVQVEVPLLGASNNLLWARLASFYASDQVGAVFYPEVGDEVIVGFVNGDPRSAIILGSLYSGSKHVPPLPPDENNSKKGIVTKQKMELLFDEEGPTLTLKTPAGRQLILDDKGKSVTLEDNLGNSLIMSDSGIAISTSKKVTVSADQGIDLSSSTGNITASASAGSAKVDALQVQLAATEAFKATGSVSATLESDLEAVIQGLMVKIN